MSSEPDTKRPAATNGRPRAGGPWQRLLRIPLFYKILIANATIVLVGTIAGTLLMAAFVRAGSEFPLVWVVLMALAGVTVTILVNAIILKLALRPLRLLEDTAARVQSGDLGARVPFSPLRDREMGRLTGTFNGMLDNLESLRQRLSGVAARALNAEELERKRIARELHDDTAQSLAALLIRLRLIRSADDPEIREATLDDFRTEIGEALERIRRFARGLRPPALDELGLVPALESHVRGLSESVGVAIRVEADPIEEMLTHQAELALYRIAQEALSNAVRHGEPEGVVVRIKREPRAVVLTVTDDGAGFSMEEVRDSDERGLGLFGMQERAGYVGGNVRIRSEPGKGTEVRAAIPMAVPLRGLLERVGQGSQKDAPGGPTS
ncbi:MAG: sensor histidine kinase [Gemmatimonadota bacterium]